MVVIRTWPCVSQIPTTAVFSDLADLAGLFFSGWPYTVLLQIVSYSLLSLIKVSVHVYVCMHMRLQDPRPVRIAVKVRYEG